MSLSRQLVLLVAVQFALFLARSELSKKDKVVTMKPRGDHDVVCTDSAELGSLFSPFLCVRDRCHVLDDDVSGRLSGSSPISASI